MNNKVRHHFTVSQLIGLLLMIAGLAGIFSIGRSASQQKEHIPTESENEFMEQSDSEEEKDLLESWTKTAESTRKAAEFPLLVLCGFLVVAGAPLLYTPIVVAAHKSRMSRREDAEERKARRKSSYASRRIDRELKKEEERALAEAEAVRREQKEKWERKVMENARAAVKEETKKVPENVITVTPEELNNILAKLARERIAAANAAGQADQRLVPEKLGLSESKEEKQKREEVREYFDKYDKEPSGSAPALTPEDAEFLRNIENAGNAAEQLYENARREAARNRVSCDVMPDTDELNVSAAPAKPVTEEAPSMEALPKLKQTAKPPVSGKNNRTGGKKKHKKNKKKRHRKG